MQLFICLIALLGLAVSPLLAYQSYNNYTVYRLQAQNDKQLEYLQALEDSGLDFWRSPDRVNHFADVLVSPTDKVRVLAGLNDVGITSTVMIEDVQQMINLERAELQNAARMPVFQQQGSRREAINGFWNTFQRYARHVALCEALEQQNPGLVKVFSLGRSYEGRDIKVMRIGIDSSDNKKVIFIEGGIHAREWASPATVSYFAQELVNRKNDPNVRSLLRKYDFYIIPVLNVDGYEYTHTNNRFWRKTRRPSEKNRRCVGADPNRNYGYKWGGLGTSSDPCSEIYRGDKAFSEPEVAAERNFMVNRIGANRIRSFVAVHSYGQYWLYPWGYDKYLTADDAKLQEKANIATTKLREKHGTRYTVGTSAGVLYAAAGGSDDYAYSLGVTYSYTVELRDTGANGFRLPAYLIKPTAEETTEGLIAMYTAIADTPGE